MSLLSSALRRVDAKWAAVPEGSPRGQRGHGRLKGFQQEFLLQCGFHLFHNRRRDPLGSGSQRRGAQPTAPAATIGPQRAAALPFWTTRAHVRHLEKPLEAPEFPEALQRAFYPEPRRLSKFISLGPPVADNGEGSKPQGQSGPRPGMSSKIESGPSSPTETQRRKKKEKKGNERQARIRGSNADGKSLRPSDRDISS